VSRRYPEEKGSKSLTTETISEIVPETNPFLREVLATFLDVGGRKKGGIDFDELGVQDVVELLRSDETDMRAILEDFGNRKQGEDPVIHFYEDYLKAYNKELKVKRGVFYTPQPVVSYIVRSVHELLQTEFGIEDGLASTITWGEMAARPPLPSAREGRGEGERIKIPEPMKPEDPFVVILDPATGTATFLVEVIDVVHKHLQKKWKDNRAACWALLRLPNTQHPTPNTSFRDFWNAYVPDHLLPRLYGYELMMAPYAIAHMKVGLKLGETGYNFASSQRVRIYLTNALEPASELQARLALDWEALAHEAMAVKAVKETQRFTVVIGNPPYSSVSSNLGPEERKLIDPYRSVAGQRIRERGALQLEKNLQDDYVKFIRLSQLIADAVPIFVQGMVTNHAYLANPTLRGMRSSLLST
jgi:predicted helicase